MESDQTAMISVLQEILERLGTYEDRMEEFESRLSRSEALYRELVDYEGEEDGEEEDEEPDLTEVLTSIGEVLQMILHHLDRMTVGPEDKADPVQKSDPDDYPDDGYEEDEGPNLTEQLTSIGELLQMVLHRLDELPGKLKGDPDDYPDDGYEDDDEPDEVWSNPDVATRRDDENA